MNVPNRVPWINLLVGIMMIISPYALGSNAAILTSCWIAGIIIVIAAIIELAIYAGSQTSRRLIDAV